MKAAVGYKGKTQLKSLMIISILTVGILEPTQMKDIFIREILSHSIKFTYIHVCFNIKAGVSALIFKHNICERISISKPIHRIDNFLPVSLCRGSSRSSKQASKQADSTGGSEATRNSSRASGRISFFHNNAKIRDFCPVLDK